MIVGEHVVNKSPYETCTNVLTVRISLVSLTFYIPQRGVQWEQGVVIYMMLYTTCII